MERLQAKRNSSHELRPKVRFGGTHREMYRGFTETFTEHTTTVVQGSHIRPK